MSTFIKKLIIMCYLSFVLKKKYLILLYLNLLLQIMSKFLAATSQESLELRVNKILIEMCWEIGFQ